MTAPQHPRVTIQKGRSSRLRKGHPWLFSNEVDMTPQTKALPRGGLVSVIDAGGEALGIATFNPHSLIAARLLTADPAATIDAGFIANRLRRALSLRDTLFPQPYYRLIHSEADGLPGLIVDRYGDVVSVQFNSAGMDQLRDCVLEALHTVLKPTAIVLRNDSPVRALEGLDSGHEVVFGSIDGPVEIVENGTRFLADVATGQKTGWFFDQRPNRAFIASLAKGRTALDVYSYAGGFGLTALTQGAKSALLVDRSEEALSLAKQAAALNGMGERLDTRCGDGFKVMEALQGENRRFGVVIADPPAFVKTRKDLASGSKGYRKMARLAAALVENGGFLLCGSCSHHMPADQFFEEVSLGIGQAGRSGRVLWSHGAGPDHPVHPHLPESAYLKALAFQLD
ncbi:class I SAM-dependent rRNA methyltransferase [Novispirillum itersonii]|uniref:class I SAM-dependent rRNA methyltransferase n=1 Tax=Novispirillum itersonii TaxID=189 RepID=UPI00036C34AA|nr:class I SAM-dependent rRNA methyltransferase [Novispirillum itersonii]